MHERMELIAVSSIKVDACMVSRIKIKMLVGMWS